MSTERKLFWTLAYLALAAIFVVKLAQAVQLAILVIPRGDVPAEAAPAQRRSLLYTPADATPAVGNLEKPRWAARAIFVPSAGCNQGRSVGPRPL